jgi:alkylation response protein AidB-like acyl-CoA dehydrogenase
LAENIEILEENGGGGGGSSSFRISTSAAENDNGKVVNSRKILISAGSYSGLLPLMSEATNGQKSVKMTYTAQVLAMIEINENEAERLK